MYIGKVNENAILEEDLDLTVIGPDSTRYEGKELIPTQEHLKVAEGKAGESYEIFLRQGVCQSYHLIVKINPEK